MAGKKYDQGKNRYDLLDVEFLDGLVNVLTYGANKYADNNWKLVDNAEERYFAALMRHIVAYRRGELVDKESGLNHLYHAAANLMFLAYFQKNK